MADVLSALQPQSVWHYFEQICKYPHPSKKEDKLARYIIDFADEHGLDSLKDSHGNIVIRKPASSGMVGRKPIVIQGHIDMVCEKNRDVEFDFDNDPIQPFIEGDWVRAKGTTLGADNGIGIAMGMAILASTDIDHPDIELLCTLDEETGLTGAIQLDRDLLKADILINLDSEEDGAFTIGCAGGQNTTGLFKFTPEPTPSDSLACEITIRGLRGGHSGIEIHDGRANAAKLLTRILWTLTNKYNIRLASFTSGNKHNAIPREGFAVVAVPRAAFSDFEKKLNDFNDTLKSEYATKEPNLVVEYKSIDPPANVMPIDIQKRLLNSFYAMPHGVIRMSPDIKDLVQTSTNFAIVETSADDVSVLTSQRSSVETEKTDICNMVRAALELGGADVVHGGGYPAWQPNINSPILKIAVEVFKELFGKEPIIEAIHAGLETGLIGEKYPDMDMLSFGPNLKDVHSPDERVQISTVQNCWRLLLEIMKNIPEK